MSAAILDAVVTDSAPETSEVLLSDATVELARLRLSLVAKMQWRSHGLGSPSHAYAAQRAEVRRLRSQYFEKIDEIAMRFGVQAAMNAQDAVERKLASSRPASDHLHHNAEDEFGD